MLEKIKNLTSKQEEKKDSFTGKRIDSVINVVKYIKEVYNIDVTPTLECMKSVVGIKSLLQADYGKAFDCSLTSITCILNFLLMGKNFSIQYIYDTVESCTKWYSYDGDKYGTIPVFIDNVFNDSLKKFKLPYKSKNKTFKEVPLVGYNINDIKKSIDNSLPVVLNIYNDGRDYYKDHTITVVGYLDYTFNVNNKKKTVHMLKVYDNWYHGFAYVDYGRIGKVSSITVLSKTK